MKTCTLILAATTLLGAATSSPLAPPSPRQNLPEKRQDQDWSFSVYQSNERCTGARDTYSGNGSRECQRGVIRNGSFGSYTNNGVREGCTVYLYATDNCDASAIIDVLEPGAPEGCQQPVIVVDPVPSFDVVCD